MQKGGTEMPLGEGEKTFCLHPKPSEILYLAAGGEGLKANVAHYCRVYAREAGEAAGKRGGHRKERRQAGSERRRK